MENINNSVASGYEIPREPKFYEYQPMPLIRHIDNKSNKVCDTCCKADVCMYKGETAKAFMDIKDITDRVNVFVNVNIQCKNYAEQVVGVR